MKEYYLPPVIEKNAKKGYKPPNRGEGIASILSYSIDKTRKKGLFSKKPVERISKIIILHYPVDVYCIEDKCIIVDPVIGEPIKDLGLIAQLVFLLQHPSPKPFIEPSIEIEALNPLEFSEKLVEDEYSIPRIKTGNARYYVPLIAVLYIGDRGFRVEIYPPLYYLSGFPSKYRDVREFNQIRKLVERIPLDTDSVRYHLETSEWVLDRSDIKDSVQKGIDKLYRIGVISRKKRDYLLREYISR